MEASDPRPDEPGVPAAGSLVAGRYRVGEVLGRGGMGVVLAATDEVLGREVVLKLLARSDASPAARARLQREARAAAAVAHPNVVAVRDVGELDGHPFLVLERLHGEDLRAFVEARPPLADVVDVALQVCAGLSAVHAAGLVHRDVKPSNLFLARERGAIVLKVLDFGIAKATPADDVPDLTATGVALGSPRYMAPEQIRDARSVDARADLWSVGIVLFEILAGRVPFDGGSAAAIGAAIASDPLPDLRALRPDLPEGLARVVERSLSKDPDARFESVRALAEALAPFGDARAADRLLAVERVAVAPSAERASRPRPRAEASGTAGSKLGATEPPRAPRRLGDGAGGDTAEAGSISRAIGPRRARVGLPRLAWAAAVAAVAAGAILLARSARPPTDPPRGGAPLAAASPAPGEQAAALPAPRAVSTVREEGPPIAREPSSQPPPPTATASAGLARRPAAPASPSVGGPLPPSPPTSAAPPQPAAAPSASPAPPDPLGASALVDRK